MTAPFGNPLSPAHECRFSQSMLLLKFNIVSVEGSKRAGHVLPGWCWVTLDDVARRVPAPAKLKFFINWQLRE